MARLLFGSTLLLGLLATGAASPSTTAEPAASALEPQPLEPPRLEPQRQRGAGSPRGGAQPRSGAPQRGGQGTRLGGSSGGRRGGSFGGNDLVAPFGMPREREQRMWFAIADADATEWISFREATGSMRFDAERFRVYDADNDGRMTFEEFVGFIRKERALGRTVPPPVEAIPDGPPPLRDAEQLRAAFDTDLDGALSLVEIDRLLLEYDRSQAMFDSAAVLRRLDSDGDRRLGVDELGRLANFLTPVGSPTGPLSKPGARTIDDLFGQPIDMGETNAPRVIGPVSPFRRLDVDNDGYITVEDLELLEGRSFSAVSLKSVLNTLDIDTDGRLSKGELLSSMTRR